MTTTAAAINVRIWRLLLAVTIFTALLVLQEILIPLAVAGLITFLLSPLVAGLQRKIGRMPAILVSAGVTFILGGLFIWITAAQVGDLAAKLPSYQGNLRAKLQPLQLSEHGPINKISSILEDLSLPDASSQDAAAPASGDAPLEVTVVDRTNPSLFPSFENSIAVFLQSLAAAGAVIILALFMLFKREDLRDRFIGLVGRGNISHTTAALREASGRIFKYLRMQLLINLCYGVVVTVALYLVGLPNAPLWGALCFVLRFIPYVGPIVAMVLPVAFSIVVFESWTPTLVMIGLFILLEILSNNLIEPWLYGSSTGISSFSLIVAALFWTWLWGLPGLLLSTPLTVCILVIGLHVPQLSFLRLLLSNQDGLPAAETCYHRLLAMDQPAVFECVESSYAKSGLEGAFVHNLLPCAAMIEEDHRRQNIDLERYRSALRSLREPLELLTLKQSAACDAAPPAMESDPLLRPSVLCVPADSPSDQFGAEALSCCLRGRDFDAKHTDAGLMLSELGSAVAADIPALLWICLVNPTGLSRCRRLVSELQEQIPDLPVGVVLLQAPSHITKRLDDTKIPGLYAMVFSLEDALSYSESLRSADNDGFVPAPIPDIEAERLNALLKLNLDESSDDELFQRVTSELTRVFEVPIALVSLIDTDHQVFGGQCGLPSPLSEEGRSSRELSVCGHVAAANTPIIVNDLAKDQRFAGNPFLREHKLRFYAGVPLRTSRGFAIGSLCIIDQRPRSVTKREVKLLQIIAEGLMRAVEARAAASPHHVALS